jgi:hypothetical protein
VTYTFRISKDTLALWMAGGKERKHFRRVMVKKSVDRSGSRAAADFTHRPYLLHVYDDSLSHP